MNNSAPNNIPPALDRFNQYLEKTGMDEKSRGFLVGRMVKVITAQVMGELGKVLGEEGMKRIEELGDQKHQQAELERVFEENKGMSLTAYRDEIAEKLVQDFEVQK